MALHLTPQPGDPGDSEAATEHVDERQVQAKRLLRDGRQVIARGALICPGCEMPLPARPAVAAAALLHCAWCGHSAPARDLLRPGVFDTAGNRVELVARLET